MHGAKHKGLHRSARPGHDSVLVKSERHPGSSWISRQYKGRDVLSIASNDPTLLLGEEPSHVQKFVVLLFVTLVSLAGFTMGQAGYAFDEVP
jgi:hypothetical protein